MKKSFSIYTLFASLSLLVILSSCDEELPAYIAYEPYAFASLDENGGNWTPNLLSSSSQIGIPAPVDATDPGFVAEVAAVKTLSASLTAEQQEAVDYWAGDGLIRWNEIARDLSAKYNLPPSPNPDGTYSVPDPANPSNYPNFPFAHPPYSSRMLAYWASAPRFSSICSCMTGRRCTGFRRLRFIRVKKLRQSTRPRISPCSKPSLVSSYGPQCGSWDCLPRPVM